MSFIVMMEVERWHFLHFDVVWLVSRLQCCRSFWNIILCLLMLHVVPLLFICSLCNMT